MQNVGAPAGVWQDAKFVNPSFGVPAVAKIDFRRDHLDDPSGQLALFLVIESVAGMIMYERLDRQAAILQILGDERKGAKFYYGLFDCLAVC